MLASYNKVQSAIIKNRLPKLSVYIFISLAVLLSSILTMPFTKAYDETFYSGNDILFFDPNDTTCDSVISSVEGEEEFEESDTLQAIFQGLLNGGMNAVQAAAVMGNMQAESGFRSDAQESGGDGYGLVQWSFGRRDNLEAYASQKGVSVSDLNLQIEFLLKEYEETYKGYLEGTAFADTNNTDLAQATEDWMNKFERPNAAYAHLDRRVAAAERVYGFYKDLDPNSTLSNSNCSNLGGGIIVQTAIKLAWSDGIQHSEPTDAYRELIGNADATDCGRFVAAVIRSSGVDPNYPVVYVPTQYTYIKSHPEKYQIIDNPSSVADLQPGDIIIYKDGSHTELYIGNAAGEEFAFASASLYGHAPMLQNIYDVNFNSDIAAVRVIQ